MHYRKLPLEIQYCNPVSFCFSFSLPIYISDSIYFLPQLNSTNSILQNSNQWEIAQYPFSTQNKMVAATACGGNSRPRLFTWMEGYRNSESPSKPHTSSPRTPTSTFAAPSPCSSASKSPIQPKKSSSNLVKFTSSCRSPCLSRRLRSRTCVGQP